MLANIKKLGFIFDPTQKLNILYFISESKTRSFSVSLPLITAGAFVMMCTFAWAAFGVFWLGSSISETTLLRQEHRELQAELFQLQNRDDAVYKEAYAMNRAPAATEIASADATPKKAEKKVEVKAVPAKPEPVKSIAADTDTKKNEVALTVISNPTLTNIADAKIAPAAPVETTIAATTTDLSKLLPAKFDLKEAGPSTFNAKVESASVHAKNNQLKVGIVIKSVSGAGVGGGIQAKLTYFKKDQDEPVVETLPTAANSMSGKYLFLATDKGSPKEIGFTVPADEVKSFSKLEISLLSSNCLPKVENCEKAVDTVSYEIPLMKTKPLANTGLEKEAG